MHHTLKSAIHKASAYISKQNMEHKFKKIRMTGENNPQKRNALMSILVLVIQHNTSLYQNRG